MRRHFRLRDRTASDQFHERLERYRPHVRDIDKDAVKRAGLQRFVQWHGYRVSGRSRMPQPYMAALLPEHRITEVLQSAY